MIEWEEERKILQSRRPTEHTKYMESITWFRVFRVFRGLKRDQRRGAPSSAMPFDSEWTARTTSSVSSRSNTARSSMKPTYARPSVSALLDTSQLNVLFQPLNVPCFLPSR